MVTAAVVTAVVGGIFAVVVAAVPALIVGPPNPNPSPTPLRSSTDITGQSGTEPAPTYKLAPIRVDQVQDPPRCAKFTGSGDVPDGKTLWLVVQSDEPKYYFYPTIPEPLQHRWAAENVTLGLSTESPVSPLPFLRCSPLRRGTRISRN